MKKRIFPFIILAIGFILLFSPEAWSQNVGIGVANPKAKLDVNGNLRIGVHLSQDSLAGLIRYNGSEFEGWDSTRWIPMHTMWTKTGTGAADIYRPSGNVGIGLNSPPTRLGIYEKHNKAAILIKRDSIGDLFQGMDMTDSLNPFLIQIDRNTPYGGTHPETYTRLSIGNGYPNQFTLHQNGKIGYGTDNPGNYQGIETALVEFSANDPQRSDWVIRVASEQPNGYPAVIFAKSAGFYNSPTPINNGHILGGFLFNGYDGTQFVRSSEIRIQTTGTVSTGIVPSDILFLTSIPDVATFYPTEKMRINASGHVLVQKYLEVGDATHTGLFDVHFNAPSAGSGGAINLYAQDGTTSGSSYGGNIFIVPGKGNGSSGKHGVIGIGTASPQGFLDVRGDTALNGNGKNILFYGQSGARTGNTNGGNILLIPGIPYGTGTIGKVGIGTTTPGEILDVAGNIKLSGYLKIGTGASYTFPSTDGSSGQVLSTNGTGTLSWASSGGSYLPLAGGTMTDGANIAVGTTLGTKIGTATSQKLGFFNTTPVVQQTGNMSTALANLGLVTSGTLPWTTLTSTPTTLAGYSISDATPSGRTISTTAPLAGGGDLSANRTLTISQASSTSDGYLSHTDWSTFNGKGTVTGVTGTAPILSSGGNSPAISITQASSTSSGYLSASDWTTFNSKLSTGLTSGNIWVGNSSNVATAVVPSGDVTIDNTGVTSIGANKVVTSKILDANVTYAKIQNVSATDKVLGRVSAGAGVVEEISTTGTGNVVRANAPTITGVNLTSGSTTVEPLSFTSGTSLTTPSPGAVEYDGNAFYSTTASGRGVAPSVLFVAVQSDFTLSASSGVQSCLPATSDILTVAATTTYFFDGQYIINTGGTSHTTALAFALGGGASVTSFEYTTEVWTAAANAISIATSLTHVSGVASKVLNATSNAVYTIIKFQGVARINAGGTLTPQISFSVNPTGTNLMKVGSYIRFYPAGTNTVQSIGPWN